MTFWLTPTSYPVKMKKLLFIIMACAFTALGRPGYCQSASDTAQTDSLQAAAKYHAEIKSITSDIKKQRHNSDKRLRAGLYVLRARTEVKINQFEAALNDCSEAIRLDPRYGEAYFMRAALYRQLNNDDKAVKDYKKVLLYVNTGDNNKAAIYNLMAQAYRRIKKYKDAINADSAAIVLNPGFAAAYASRGELYAIEKRYQLAINDYNVAMYGYQDNHKVLSILYAERADMYRSLKQYGDAINDYSEALNLDPDNKIAYWNRAAAYNLNGDYQLADADYSKAIQYFKDDKKSLSRLYDDRARMEIGIQQYDKAIRDDSVAVSIDSTFWAAHWSMADAYSQEGDYQRSNAIYRQVLDHFKDNKLAQAEIYTSVAHNEYFLNEFPKVVEDCTKAIDLKTTFWDTYLERGRAYLRLGKKDLALADFRKVLASDTSKKTSDYAFALFYTGDADDAVKVMQNSFIATNNPYELMVDYYNMACLLSLMNKPDEANAFLKKCIDAGYSKRYALTDADLDNIRNTPEFKSIIAGASQ